VADPSASPRTPRAAAEPVRGTFRRTDQGGSGHRDLQVPLQGSGSRPPSTGRDDRVEGGWSSVSVVAVGLSHLFIGMRTPWGQKSPASSRVGRQYRQLASAGPRAARALKPSCARASGCTSTFRRSSMANRWTIACPIARSPNGFGYLGVPKPTSGERCWRVRSSKGGSFASHEPDPVLDSDLPPT
jgi:hypothetical protein